MKRQHAFVWLLILTLYSSGISARAANDHDKPSTYTQAEVRAYLKVKQGQETGNVDWSFEAFKRVNDDKPVYAAEVVNNWGGFNRPTIHRHGAAAEPKKIFQGVKIRASFDDVLTSEDPTSSAFGGDEKSGVSDLTGASFSYTHDYREDSNAWATKGALLLPFSVTRDVSNTTTSQMALKNYGFVPSVSFDRETNDQAADKEVNSLIFRTGVFAKWLGPKPLTALTLRAYFTYGTDFEFKSATPAAELELEPVIGGRGAFGIGSRHFIFPADAASVKTFALTNVAYQLRATLHGYYGQTVDAGKTGAPEQDFARLGPKLQLRLDPLFTKRLTCNINYEYQGDIVGHSTRHGLLSIEPEFVLNPPSSDDASLDKPIIKLHLSYQDGGIDLTAENVHTLLIGLGVTL
jgi:hypothetical protein